MTGSQMGTEHQLKLLTCLRKQQVHFKPVHVTAILEDPLSLKTTKKTIFFNNLRPSQLFKAPLAFQEKQSFITVFIQRCHLSLSCASSVQCTAVTLIRDTAIHILTRLWAGQLKSRGSILERGKRYFSSSKCPDGLWEQTTFYSGGKVAGE
jgi:hypothetical protein